jgi:hypothetical protein
VRTARVASAPSGVTISTRTATDGATVKSRCCTASSAISTAVAVLTKPVPPSVTDHSPGRRPTSA